MPLNDPTRTDDRMPAMDHRAKAIARAFFPPPLVLRGRAGVGAAALLSLSIPRKDPHPNPSPEYQGREQEKCRRARDSLSRQISFGRTTLLLWTLALCVTRASAAPTTGSYTATLNTSALKPGQTAVAAVVVN